MPNVDRPHGFRPIYAKWGVHGQTGPYTLDSTHGRIAKGDLVEEITGGFVRKGTSSSVSLKGVAAQTVAANTGGTIQLYDNPGQVYEAQTDDGTGDLTIQAAMTKNANFVDTVSTTQEHSIMEIDENTGDTTATLPLKILRLYPAPDNALGEFNRLEVMINNHVHKSTGVAGV